MGTLYNKKYDPKYCEMLVDHMETGASFESFAGKIKVGIRTIYDWCEAYPEFEAAKQVGFGVALNALEERVIASITGQEVKNFDTDLVDKRLLWKYLSTRFHKIYGKKTENVNHNVHESYEDYIRRLKDEQNKEKSSEEKDSQENDKKSSSKRKDGENLGKSPENPSPNKKSHGKENPDGGESWS